MKAAFHCVYLACFIISCQHATENRHTPEASADTLRSEITLENPLPDRDTSKPQIDVGTDYLMGKFDPAIHPDFTQVEKEHADREGMYLREDVYAAFIRMFNAAKEDGVRLQIRSAARNFNYQKGIWERKWTGETRIENGKDASVAYPDPVDRAEAILKYSSMPGTSRHHWGTDIDLNSFNNDWFGEGEGLRLYTWMREHAHDYGFCQPYSDNSEEDRTGYEEERWHWSYMPVATPLTRQAGKELTNEMITGFMGAETAATVDMVGNYVLGISSNCLAQQHSSGE